MPEMFTVGLVIAALIALALCIAFGWQIVEIEIEIRKPQPEPKKSEPFRCIGMTDDGFAIYE